MKLILAVDGFHLPVHRIFVEKRLFEKLREDVKGLSELLVANVEVEVGVIISCCGV